jgi:C4-dicarboxylate transporter, DctQ subunit
MKALDKLHRWLLTTEDLLLVLLLLSMIVIAVVQILMRNFFGGGLLWADAYTRTSVLWITLIGAMMASRRHRHISIDVFAQHLPGNWRDSARRLRDFLTGSICFAGAWFSAGFVIQEYSYGDIAFANIASWQCQAIMPLAFAIMALRYVVAAFLPADRDRTE